jgi:hypothetical protein
LFLHLPLPKNISNVERYTKVEFEICKYTIKRKSSVHSKIKKQSSKPYLSQISTNLCTKKLNPNTKIKKGSKIMFMNRVARF